MDRDEISKDVKINEERDKWQRLKGGLFLTSVTGCSILAGFGLTMGMAKKSDPEHFAKGLSSSKHLTETGVELATRTLMKASLYTVTGFGVFCFAVWKIMGVHSMEEFRQKVGNSLPKLKRKESEGRNEFATIRDLFDYIVDEDRKKKSLKAHSDPKDAAS